MPTDPAGKAGPHGSLDEPCPTCGYRPLARILWGFPAGLPPGYEEGYVALGGCCISPDDPSFECPRCRTRFWDDGRIEVPTSHEQSV